MESHLPEYELYAIRYAERDARRSDHFIGGDPHDGPMPTDYFMWVAIAPHHTVVIDTGFTAEVAAARKRRFLRSPIEAFSLVGVDGDAVKDVVLTHMHYDHVGNFHRLPNAQFHPGGRIALHDGPPHAPSFPRPLLRSRRRGRDRAAEFCAARQAL
jgi:glyoxylase-like metal-dependent hydrolase (beta-lactamase superfamily II)